MTANPKPPAAAQAPAEKPADAPVAAQSEKKGLSTEEKLSALIGLAKSNGWSIPKDLED